MNSYSMLSQTMSEVQKSKNQSSGKKSNTSSGSKITIARDKPEEINLDSGPEDQETDPNVPDRSYGDYYCKICDSHMNSDNMWEAHVTGKRHIKNVKKGDTDSKYEDLENEESNIKYEIRNVRDPIIGLSYIHEIRRREPNVPPLYNCFLCHASIATVPLVIEHVISMKHRLNYIKENNPEEYQLLDATNLKKGHMEPLVLEAATRMEEKDGRGTVKVKQEKKKAPPTFTWGKGYEAEPDEREFLPRNNPHIENESVWRSLDPLSHIQGDRKIMPSSTGRRERSKSPRDYHGARKRSRSRSRSRSPPRAYKESHKRYSSRDLSPKRDYHDSYSRNSDRDRRDDHIKKIDREKERDHMDDYKRKSDRQMFSGSSRKNDRDDHLKRYDSDLRKSDRKKDSNLSPPYKGSSYSREPVGKDFPPKDPPNKYYEKSSPYEGHLLPHEKPAEKPTSDVDLSQFVMSILMLPSDIFLKIAITRVESLSLKGLDELKLLYKLSTATQAALTRELPSDLLQFFKQKSSQDVRSNVPSSSIPGLDIRPNDMPSSSRPTKDASNLKFLTSILDIVNSSNSTAPIQRNVEVPQNAPSFPSSSVNVPPPINAPAFVPPPANSYQISSAAYQTPSPNSYQSAPNNTYQTTSTSSYQNAPSNTYQTASTSSYPPSAVNLYPGQNSNSFQNVNPSYSYNNPQPTTSSNIPGLTLTEQATPETRSFDYSYASVPAANKFSHRY